MAYEFQINVPTTARDIKLGQWQKYAEIYEKNKDNTNRDFLSLKMLEIFCGVSLNDSHKLPISTFDAILEHLGELLNENTPRVNRFNLIGSDDVELKLGLLPNLDKMTYGEWTDLDEYIYDNKTLHKAMAVLYRPLVWEKSDRYIVHEYKGTDELSEVMKEMPFSVALGARDFFFRLARKLGTYTLDSTLKQLTQVEEAHSKNPSEKNGAHTNQYMNLQMEKLKKLDKLLDKTSMNL